MMRRLWATIECTDFAPLQFHVNVGFQVFEKAVSQVSKTTFVRVLALSMFMVRFPSIFQNRLGPQPGEKQKGKNS